MFNLDALQNYIDEVGNGELYYKAVIGAGTLEKNLIMIQPDIKTSMYLNTLESTLVAVAGFCGTSFDDTTVLDKVELKVDEIQIDRSFCLKDLEQKWAQIAFQAGSYQETLPLEAVFMAEQDQKVSSLIEAQIWKGDKDAGVGNLGLNNGFIKSIEDATGVISVTGSNYTSDPIAAMDLYIQSMPEELLDVDTYAYMSPRQFAKYINAAIDSNLYHVNPVTDYYSTGIQHRGSKLKVYPVNGLSGVDSIIITYKENLYVGLDLQSDPTNYVAWFEMKDKMYYISINYKLGTAVLWPSHVVYVTF